MKQYYILRMYGHGCPVCVIVSGQYNVTPVINHFCSIRTNFFGGFQKHVCPCVIMFMITTYFNFLQNEVPNSYECSWKMCTSKHSSPITTIQNYTRNNKLDIKIHKDTVKCIKMTRVCVESTNFQCAYKYYLF